MSFLVARICEPVVRLKKDPNFEFDKSVLFSLIIISHRFSLFFGRSMPKLAFCMFIITQQCHFYGGLASNGLLVANVSILSVCSFPHDNYHEFLNERHHLNDLFAISRKCQ